MAKEKAEKAEAPETEVLAAEQAEPKAAAKIDNEAASKVAKEPAKETPKEPAKDSAKVAALEEQLRDIREKAIANQAEYENSKKRLAKDYDESKKYATSKLLTKLIAPLDQLRKLVNNDKVSDEVKVWLTGFKMIVGNIFNELELEGVKPIKSIGEKFNPKYHYAVEQVPTEDVSQDHVIKEELATGYTFNERVLKTATVKVAVVGGEDINALVVEEEKPKSAEYSTSNVSSSSSNEASGSQSAIATQVQKRELTKAEKKLQEQIEKLKNKNK